MEVLNGKAVIAELLSLKSQTFRRVVEAVEKTAVKMSNDAKAGHERGSDPHSRDRYENQTNNLTNSIFPGGSDGQPMKWEKLSEDEVVGLFGVESTAPGSPLEYAPYIEERYPFIWPAVVANLGYFTQEMKKAAPSERT
jgi:hypothetical protein